MSARATFPVTRSASGPQRPNPYAPPGVRYYASARDHDRLAEKGQNLVTIVLVFLSLGQVAPAILVLMGRAPFVPYGIAPVLSLILYRSLYNGSPLARKLMIGSVVFLLGYFLYLGLSIGAHPEAWLFLGMMAAIPGLVGLFFWKTPSVRAFYGVD